MAASFSGVMVLSVVRSVLSISINNIRFSMETSGFSDSLSRGCEIVILFSVYPGCGGDEQ